MKTFLKFFLLISIIFFCIVISLFLWFDRPFLFKNDLNKSYEFEIKTGDNAYLISGRLKDLGLINSKELFIIIVRLLRLDKNLKTGWVEINHGDSTVKIIRNIYTGNFITITFTIPEGSTINDIKRILIENKILESGAIDEFLSNNAHLKLLGLNNFKSAEGFLFPDTYKFLKGVSAVQIFSAMVKLFYKKIEEIYPEYNDLSKEELYKKLIMASIIEKEAKATNETSIIAGVFYNRLKIGMKLQSCATVQYILQKPKEQLLESDLLIDNPYNTYIYKNLPPGPICNPGVNALKACFFPAKHEYLFFVVMDPEKGTHHFSKTYEEHLQAQKIYKKVKGFY